MKNSLHYDPWNYFSFQDHNDEIRQEQMREMQILGGRNGMLLPIDGLGGGGGGTNNGDAHTDGSGSLSPPSSLSPPPAVSVKLPQTHTTIAQPPAPQGTMASHQQPQQMAAANFLAATHPAMRGLSRAQMGLLTTSKTYHLQMPRYILKASFHKTKL